MRPSPARTRHAAASLAAALVVAGGALAACGEGPTAEPAGLRYADVATDYAAASERLQREGRSVVTQLLAGDVASVYARFSPMVTADISLVEAERTVGRGEGGQPPSAAGPRSGWSPLGAARGAYLAEQATCHGEDRAGRAHPRARCLRGLEDRASFR